MSRKTINFSGIEWYIKNVFFESYHGHYKALPSKDYLINQWYYDGNNNQLPGNERLHINLWLFSGHVQRGQNEAKPIINAVHVPNL